MGRPRDEFKRRHLPVRHAGRSRGVTIPALCIVCLAFVLPLRAQTSAHPLGNFTINHFTQLSFSGRTVLLHYVVDIAEIPTYDEIKVMDTNGDRVVDQSEKDVYLPKRVGQLRAGLHLTSDGRELPLTTGSSSMDLKLGQAGLRVLRIDVDFTTTLPESKDALHLHFADDNFKGHIGWHEIVAQASNGDSIGKTNALASSVSDQLRSYPANSSTHPLDIESADIEVRSGASTVSGTIASSSLTAKSPATAGGLSSWPASLVSIGDLSPWVTLLTLLAALLWGASHALTPGHGKTIVAAYLVGSKGTPRHALLLGLTVTATHTAGVFALGCITLYLSRFILPEHLYPWMDLLSGLLVVGIGAGLAYRRFADSHRTGVDDRALGSHGQLSADERHALAHLHGLSHHHGNDHDSSARYSSGIQSSRAACSRRQRRDRPLSLGTRTVAERHLVGASRVRHDPRAGLQCRPRDRVDIYRPAEPVCTAHVSALFLRAAHPSATAGRQRSRRDRWRSDHRGRGVAAGGIHLRFSVVAA